MFLRFAFKNHGSFREATEVSFLASRVKDEDVHVPIKSDLPHAKFGVLPVLALYGGNASGKTTVLKAFERMVRHILHSQSHLSLTDEIPVYPFKLDSHSKDTPSQFECEFVVDEVRYLYGFVCTKEIFEEEWLYAWPSGSQQLWFHRKGAAREDWYFGPSLKGDRRRNAQHTRDNSLYLSTSAHLNHEQLGNIYRAFSKLTMLDLPISSHKPMMFSESPLFDEERRREVLRLLEAADLGVQDFRVRSQKVVIEKLIEQLRDSDNNDVLKTADELQSSLEKNGDPKRLELLHGGADGTGAWLEPEEESSGTISLINRLHQILSALGLGAITLIDEIDRSLHPHLCAELITLFSNPRSNPKGAQLLFSTHDVTLMKNLRRDEVLLTDKGQDGCSRLTPMSQFKLLRRDDMARVYMEGRVGGVPSTGNLSMLLSPTHKVA